MPNMFANLIPKQQNSDDLMVADASAINNSNAGAAANAVNAQNPYTDLIPQQQNAPRETNQPQMQQQPQAQSANMFANLIPQQPNAQQQPAQAPVAQAERTALQKAGDLAQEYIIDPVDAAKAGLGQFATNVHNLIMKPADVLYGTNYVEQQNAAQEQRDAEFDERFKDNSGAKAVRFLAREIPSFIPAVKAGNAITKGSQLLSKTPIRQAVASNAIAGGLASQLENPYDAKAAALGATIGAGAGAAGRAIEKVVIQPLAGAYAKTAVPGLIEKATEKVKGYINPQKGADAYKGAYETAYKKQADLIGKVGNEAKNLDQARISLHNPTLESSPYNDYLKNYLKENRKLSKANPGKAAKYQNAVDYVKNVASKVHPKTLNEAVAAKNNLNSSLKGYLGKKGLEGADSKTKAVVKELKNTLNKTIEENSSTFKSTPYDNYIKNYIKQKTKLNPAQAVKYQDAVNFAESVASKMKPKSLEDVVAVRQNLNASLKKYLEKNNIKSADHETKELIRGIKGTLNKVIDKNTPKTLKGEATQFKNDWEDWNKSYQHVQEFKKGIGQGGELVNKKALRTALEGGGALDPAIMGQFVPKANQSGIAAYEHLSKLLGSKKQATDALKSYYLRPILQNGAKSGDISNLYGKLSKPQREYLFGGSKEKDILDAVNDTMLKVGKPAAHKGAASLAHHGFSLGLPYLAGTGAAMSMGLPWDEAMLYGGLPAAIASKGVGAGVRKLATPGSVQKALKIHEKGMPKTGKAIGTSLNYLGQNAIGGM